MGATLCDGSVYALHGAVLTEAAQADRLISGSGDGMPAHGNVQSCWICHHAPTAASLGHHHQPLAALHAFSPPKPICRTTR